MNARRLCLAAILSFAVLAAAPASAAQRTFVASYGLDVNPCSIISPCRGIARALTQTDVEGEVIVLDSAGYGAFTITQSVSVIAPDGIYAGISVFGGAPNSSHGIVVNGDGIKVTLRGLTVNGQGGDDGIRIENAGNVFIEKLVVANTGNDNFDAAIRVAGADSRIFIDHSAIRDNAGYGIRIVANAAVHVRHTHLNGNGNGGVRAASPGGRLTVTESLISGNAIIGISAATTSGGTWEVTTAGSIVERSTGPGIFVGGGIAGAYRVAVTDSVIQENADTGIVLTAGATESMSGLVGDSRVIRNTANGIACTGVGSPVAILERNEVTSNGVGVFQFGSCTLKSMGNNAVENNGTDVSGVITLESLQ